ncbi:CHC2 zinc finger domain-containing protein [Streptomyces sp. NPDC057235]|uniref:CHC2 zinc finger domain-containing protein n=1 Tax=Streptomyces sp. NPDC057235 TaxID=3346058 RepID=UPI00363CFB51
MDSHGTRSRRRDDSGQGVWPLGPVLLHYGIELNAGRWGEETICCPIHGDRRPSMRVNVEKGLFHCHACGAGGTAINLIQAMESCDREDAQQRAEQICKDAGVTVSRPGRGRYTRPGEGAAPASGRKYVPPGRRSA